MQPCPCPGPGRCAPHLSRLSPSPTAAAPPALARERRAPHPATVSRPRMAGGRPPARPPRPPAPPPRCRCGTSPGAETRTCCCAATAARASPPRAPLQNRWAPGPAGTAAGACTRRRRRSHSPSAAAAAAAPAAGAAAGQAPRGSCTAPAARAAAPRQRWRQRHRRRARHQPAPQVQGCRGAPRTPPLPAKWTRQGGGVSTSPSNDSASRCQHRPPRPEAPRARRPQLQRPP